MFLYNYLDMTLFPHIQLIGFFSEDFLSSVVSQQRMLNYATACVVLQPHLIDTEIHLHK